MVDTLQDVSIVGRQIIIRHPYYGIFLSTLNRKVDNSERNPTAGVAKHGLNTQLFVNEGFWGKLTRPQKTGVLLHELLHICMFHPTMRRSFADHLLFNIAADLEINQYVLALKDVELPEGCLKLEDYGFNVTTEAEKGTRYYYEKLRKQAKSGGGTKAFKQLYEKMKQGQQTVCTHATWKEFDEMSESQKRYVEEQIERQMKVAWENCDKSRGTVPNFLRERLEDLLKPKKSPFNWKKAIRQFTGGYSQEIYTKKLRRKFNKRFEDNPGLKIKQRKRLLCAVDTSGSVSHDEFVDFMREIDVIRKAGVQVTVCECDAYVDKERGIYEFKGLGSISGRRVTGGGGTSFDPPIEYLNEEANQFSAIIYLTDGYAPVPVVKPRKPIMWVMSMSGKTPEQAKKEGFPGYVIKIPQEIEG